MVQAALITEGCFGYLVHLVLVEPAPTVEQAHDAEGPEARQVGAPTRVQEAHQP